MHCPETDEFIAYTNTIYKNLRPLLLLFHQGFSAAHKIGYFITAVTAARTGGSADLPAFIDHLNFEAAALTNVDFSFSHLMTIGHRIYLLL
jgi:hypothetical protein